MTDAHTIEAAYERLATSLAVPADAGARVAARVAQRRRRRRTTRGLGAVVGAAALVVGVALAAPGTAGSTAPRGPSYAADTTAPTTEPSPDPSPATPADQAHCDETLPPTDGALDPEVERLLRKLDDHDVSARHVEVDGDHLTISVLDDDGQVRYRLHVVLAGDDYRAALSRCP